MCFPILHHIFQDFFQNLLTWQVMGLGYSTLGRRDVLVHFAVFYSLFFFFFFLGPHPRHIEIPRLGVKLELQLLAYTTAIATSDSSCICDLHHSSWQCWILNPLSEATDRTHNFMVPSQIRFHSPMMETPTLLY